MNANLANLSGLALLMNQINLKAKSQRSAQPLPILLQHRNENPVQLRLF